MEIKKHNKKKKFYIAVIIILIISLSFGAFVYFEGNSHVSTEATNHQSTKDKKKSDDTKKPKNQQETKIPVSSEDNKTPLQYEGQTDKPNDEITGNVQILGANGNNFMVRANINQIISDSQAVCDLTLTGPTGQKYTSQVKIINNPQSSSCYGWDIPVSELGRIKGKWSANVQVSANGKVINFDSEAYF